jgi:glucose-6-phosphate dehydrogenase assembly protein OpcA
LVDIPTRPTAAGDGAGGLVVRHEPPVPGEPALRWSSRAHSIDEIDKELARIWSAPKLTTSVDGAEERHIAARTSVMNLVVAARRPEIGEHSAAVIQQLTGKHPSRTLILTSADPESRSWLDAQIRAYCVLPREEAAETCAEQIFITAGGEAGRHLDAIVAPLLIHDLPVTLWWPTEPPFTSAAVGALLDMANRLVVDGSTWSGDGLTRLREMAHAMDKHRLVISDFALVRQSRWREAIASVFDLPDFLPYLRSLRRISVAYGTHDPVAAPGSTNVVKPVYHVAWLASRLGMTVERPLAPADGPGRAGQRLHATRHPGHHPAGHAGQKPPLHRGLVAGLLAGKWPVSVVVRPLESKLPSGTTLRVELLADRRGSELRADVTAEAESVHVRVWVDGVEALDRAFLAARRTEVDLLGEAIELGGSDPVGRDAVRMAAMLIGP